MIKRLSLEQVSSLNLVPAAAIAAPIERFKDLGVEFDHSADDLDELEIAAFMLEGTGAFGLVRYVHCAGADTTLLLENEGRDQKAFATVLSEVATALRIPTELFSWRSGRTVRRRPA